MGAVRAGEVVERRQYRRRSSSIGIMIHLQMPQSIVLYSQVQSQQTDENRGLRASSRGVHRCIVPVYFARESLQPSCSWRGNGRSDGTDKALV